MQNAQGYQQGTVYMTQVSKYELHCEKELLV